MSILLRLLILFVGAAVLPFCTVWLDLKFNHGQIVIGFWVGVLVQVATIIGLIYKDETSGIADLLLGVFFGLIWAVMFWAVVFFYALYYNCEYYSNCL